MVDSFDARSYLHTYYKSVSDQNKDLMKFLHEVFNKIDSGELMIDIGSGPTIYQLISASTVMDSIQCSDYAQTSREELRKWIQSEQDSFNWSNYFDYVLKMKSKKINNKNRKELQSNLRESLISPVHCDVTKSPPIRITYETIDVVTAFFCPESVTKSREAFREAIGNIIDLCCDGSHLVMALLKNAQYWKAGDQKFECYPVDEDEIGTLLQELGATVNRIETHPVVEEGEIEGHILLKARF